MCTLYDKHMMYGSWDIEWDRQIFLVNLDHILPFYPPNNPKNKTSEKLKKHPVDIIILHMRTINDNHMMYCSWGMVCNRQNFLSFWTVFCPFTPPPSPLTTWKIKILKKWKKCWSYHYFIQVYQKSWSNATLFLKYGTWRI